MFCSSISPAKVIGHDSLAAALESVGRIGVVCRPYTKGIGGAPMAANVRDVAQYILDQNGSMTTWKLQKLVYYCQAWSLVWDDEPLFEEPIEAWANGPVVRVLYELHKGQYTIRTIRRANPSRLTLTQKETIDAVLEAYGNKDGVWLRDLTHREKPWKETRQRSGLREDERGNAIINLDDMEEYYSGLLDAEG